MTYTHSPNNNQQPSTNISTNSMVMYKLRLTEQGDVCQERIVEFFGDNDYIAVRELVDDKNPHYHVLFKDERQLEAVRNWVKRGFNVKGNKQYSLNDGDPVAGINYICKGASRGNEPELFGTRKVTDEEKHKAHHAYWDYIDSQQKETAKENFLDYLIKEFDKRFGTKEDMIKTKRYPNSDDIERFLLDRFFVMRKLWDTGVVAKYRNYLEYRMCPDTHLNNLKANRRI